MKLLIERNTANFDCVIEEINNDKSKEKQYWITGPFLQAEIKNQNKRIYPLKVLQREANRYIKEKINDNQGVGELGHPDVPSINLDRVSHKIVSLNQEGNNWIGKAKILSTPNGNIVKNLINEGIKFGVSSRGLGSIKEENDISYVKDDYFLITPADIVADPSGPDCWSTAIMEGKEWAFDKDGAIYEKSKSLINKAVSKNKIDEMKLLIAFETVLDLIAKKNKK